MILERRYPEAVTAFAWSALWDLFDGDRTRLNLAHECVDRWVGRRDTAIRLQRADGGRETWTFADLAAWSGRFAHHLADRGIAAGDRVALMLEPSLPFYGALFGTLKRGAVAVPLFTLFGPDALAPRLADSGARLVVTGPGVDAAAVRALGVETLPADAALDARLAREPDRYEPATAADDLAVLQYTSGTTRALPEAVRHAHRSVVTLMIAALYGLGLAEPDRCFCPSSPAWGHGLWHGTISPLALGLSVGAYAGRFDAARLLDGLRAFAITNLTAAPTVYRLLRDSGLVRPRELPLAKLTYTGEPMDASTWDFCEEMLGLPPCGIYGSTEVGVIIVNYPGFAGYTVRRGALGVAAPGWEVAIVDEADRPLPPGEVGEIAVRRKGGWFRVKDRGWQDADGYFHHAGRSDDVIISAGWTMSAIEIEGVLLRHPDVRDAAVVVAPDALRGQVPLAYVVSPRTDAGFVAELQAHVQERLGRHEYPRRIQLVDALPRTPAGKVDRHALRQRARAGQGS
ncbi:MAG TPA: acyl-CoA synthetase [Candidatus Tectomicrobia bacterium]|nr:acyl-CoA synthetase [Candidatus Tectomicrobia bacterium]